MDSSEGPSAGSAHAELPSSAPAMSSATAKLQNANSRTQVRVIMALLPAGNAVSCAVDESQDIEPPDLDERWRGGHSVGANHGPMKKPKSSVFRVPAKRAP